jgi:glycosyltransferase involved in cell wall biosynthesis
MENFSKVSWLEQVPCILPPVILSVAIVTHNEEANLARTLESVKPLVSDGKGEVIVVDSGSTDGTVEIAKSYGAKVFVEEWKGYAAQKNSAIDKATGDWILSLDADEEITSGLAAVIARSVGADDDSPKISGMWISRKNFFLGRWIRHGGFYPDRKLRLFRRGKGRFEDRQVHETVQLDGKSYALDHSYDLWGSDIDLIHHSYPTLSDYIDHMNRYSSLGAETVVSDARRGFSVIDIVVRPAATFIYNYFFRLGFLDGREGLLLHLYHAVYVSWKYAKAWELSRRQP